ncbi:MAG: V-type ATPase subunit [Clostridia bacterium]|nr:V-type ATPase subunit [Clostridia bacterium]
MAVDSLFTNGIIAVREKYLLKDKIVRMCEVGADEAFRMLVESGFGAGESVSSVYEYEKLLLADSRSTDDFIREFCPSKAALHYLLAPRDFHNAKAVAKAEHLGTDPAAMLAPDGVIPAGDIQACFRSGDFTPLYGELGKACSAAKEYFSQENSSGAEVGAIFDKALYEHLKNVCGKNKTLKNFVSEKADMTNILTAMRSADADFAAKYYVKGGSISFDTLSKIFSGEEEALKAFQGSGKQDFVKLCFAAKAEGKPLTEAEKRLSSYEADALAVNKYDLKANLPFLYYVLRRRTENENVRIVFVCLLNGMPEREIKSRLRGVQVK